jgi:hypothetical protein
MSSSILPIIHSANKLFLTGPYGSGKTTLAIERVRWLLTQERVRGDNILVLIPQRTLAGPYTAAFRGANALPGTPVQINTLSGLARNAVELYWPLLARSAGFQEPTNEPTFLNLETAQYHMSQFVDSALQSGTFAGIRLERNRIISQILDNLNKAALHGFSIDETYARLELAVTSGEQRTAQLNALRTCRRISEQFRQLCYDQALIDFSLQVELLHRQILTNDWSRTHLFRSYSHLIFDNAEEDNAVTQLLVRQWLPQLSTALIISDTDAGYRIFLGANPLGVRALQAASSQSVELVNPITGGPATEDIVAHISSLITLPIEPAASGANLTQLPAAYSTPATPVGIVLPETDFRFFPQMIAWTASEIRRLVVDEGMPPGEIAVLSPYLSDALRFSLQTALANYAIPSTTHRPSRPIQDEPAVQSLLTLAALAHPSWQIRPAPADISMTLELCIEGMDPVRASLLTAIIYPTRRQQIELGTFADLNAEAQERIMYTVGERYDMLRDWLYTYRTGTDVLPLDQFFARLFGEVLSQPGFGFHEDYDSARVANQLVQSARNFRWALSSTSSHDQNDTVVSPLNLGHQYLRLIESGAIGALYLPGWREAPEAVFIAPAYTFLMRNRTVEVQFWLDIGSSGWWERLYQPLTHPHVLSRSWPANKIWTDLDEYQTRQQTMRNLLVGLLRRTSRKVYLGISNYSESGFEQHGALLNLVNRLLVKNEGPVQRVSH